MLVSKCAFVLCVVYSVNVEAEETHEDEGPIEKYNVSTMNTQRPGLESLDMKTLEEKRKEHKSEIRRLRAKLKLQLKKLSSLRNVSGGVRRTMAMTSSPYRELMKLGDVQLHRFRNLSRLYKDQFLLWQDQVKRNRNMTRLHKNIIKLTRRITFPAKFELDRLNARANLHTSLAEKYINVTGPITDRPPFMHEDEDIPKNHRKYHLAQAKKTLSDLQIAEKKKEYHKSQKLYHLKEVEQLISQDVFDSEQALFHKDQIALLTTMIAALKKHNELLRDVALHYECMPQRSIKSTSLNQPYRRVRTNVDPNALLKNHSRFYKDQLEELENMTRQHTENEVFYSLQFKFHRAKLSDHTRILYEMFVNITQRAMDSKHGVVLTPENTTEEVERAQTNRMGVHELGIYLNQTKLTDAEMQPYENELRLRNFRDDLGPYLEEVIKCQKVLCHVFDNCTRYLQVRT